MPIEIDDTNIIINDDSTTSNILEVIKSKGSYPEKAADSSVYSCGYGYGGRLGHGNNSNKYTPTLIQYFITYNITISHIYPGEQHTIFLATNGYIYSCGWNGYGQLGQGNTSTKYTPTLIQYFIDESITISKIYTGYDHSLFLDTNGRVYLCGRGDVGGTLYDKSLPTLIETYIDYNGNNINYTNITISEIGAGRMHTIFLATDNKLYSCGYSYDGESGHGDTTARYTPTLIQYFVDEGITISKISAGSYYTIFLATNGYVYSCGNGDYGKLGHGDTSAKNTPTLIQYFVDEGITISKISAGDDHSLFLATNGKIYSCGHANYGKIGHGNTTDKSTPTLIENYIDSNGTSINYTNITISQISAGANHSIFLDTNGNVYSCGYGDWGQLGHGNTTTRYTPTLILYFLTNNITISQISAHSKHNIFLSNDPYYQTIEYPAQWTYSSTDASVYHLGNVGIGTEANTSKSLTITGDINVDGNIFIDDANMSLPKYKYSLYDNEPTISNNIRSLPVYDNLTHKYIAFTYDSTRDTSGQTEYTINFPADTTCDILIVGGGGAGGGGDDGAGGGAGGLVLINNITLNGEYKILVGKGGIGDTSEDNDTENGKDTIFNVDGIDGVNSFTAVGGGGGGVGNNSSNGLRDGNDGGSGGGASGEYAGRFGGSSTQNQYIYNEFQRGYGNKGGDNPNTSNSKGSAGGGGAGFPGSDSNSTNKGVPGGDGLSIVNEINLKTHFNINDTTIGHHTNDEVYFSGGGGGGNGNDVSRDDNSGGLGGGGQGSTSGSGRSGTNALINSGGGGGGGQYTNSGRGKGGAGGSGVVIIRYALGTARNYLSNWKYSSSYDEVSIMGNVGIGKTPTTELDIDGSFIANAKNFKIEHPIVNNMHLYHACIEGPRFDNIYRGKKLVVDGYCEVDIDTECNNTGGMIPGTFVALNTDYQLYLQNNQTFDKVKGYIEDGKIKINSLNTTDNILVDWLVIGERQDRGIIKSSLTNAKGKLICEH